MLPGAIGLISCMPLPCLCFSSKATPISLTAAAAPNLRLTQCRATAGQRSPEQPPRRPWRPDFPAPTLSSPLPLSHRVPRPGLALQFVIRRRASLALVPSTPAAQLQPLPMPLLCSVPRFSLSMALPAPPSSPPRWSAIPVPHARTRPPAPHGALPLHQRRCYSAYHQRPCFVPSVFEEMPSQGRRRSSLRLPAALRRGAHHLFGVMPERSLVLRTASSRDVVDPC